MTNAFVSMEYPHWLIVAGTVLLVFGFIGLAFRKRAEAKPQETASGNEQRWSEFEAELTQTQAANRKAMLAEQKRERWATAKSEEFPLSVTTFALEGRCSAAIRSYLIRASASPRSSRRRACGLPRVLTRSGSAAAESTAARRYNGGLATVSMRSTVRRQRSVRSRVNVPLFICRSVFGTSLRSRVASVQLALRRRKAGISRTFSSIELRTGEARPYGSPCGAA